MRSEYQYYASEKITLGHDLRVYGERVDPGCILKVLTCYLHMPASKAGDVATLLVENGSTLLEIRSRARDFGKQGMSALNPFLVGEYQRVIGYSPDSDEGDTICLTVIGELWDLDEWRTYHRKD